MALLEHEGYRRAQIFTGNANPELSQLVAERLDTELSQRELVTYADGEIRCRLGESVRGNYVFVIQPHGGDNTDVNRAIVEQQILCDAASGGSADKVFAVCPYFGYSRQDRKAAGREPITARLICKSLKAAGADGIIGIDLHAGQIQGFFDGPFDNLTAAPVLRQAILPELTEGVVVVSPDAGRIKTASSHRKRLPEELGATSAYIDKSRPTDKANTVEALEVIGDVADRQCLIIDDMVDTAGSLKATADILIARGASDILAIATHALLSGNAVERLGDSAIRRLVVTDTLALTPEKAAIKCLEVTSVSEIIAAAIRAIFYDESISKIFEGENHH